MELSDEVDRTRTKWDAYGALAIEMSTVGATAARRLRPAGGILRNIGKLLGLAKEEETAGELPGPSIRKQLEPPRKQLAPPSDAHEQGTTSASDTDDELPF